jgi:tetraacyldisaccharide 4'-kinase
MLQTIIPNKGIGHPQRFFDTLSELGVLVEPHAFSDHYAFTEKELSFVG